jgi:hypothetical protein
MSKLIKEVTVVIPVWKNQLSENEEISLKQNLNILNEFIFSIVTHPGVDLANILELIEKNNNQYRIVYFPEEFFQGLKGYNKLLLSLRFYLTFIKYDYILICQLDSFVFRNELKHWIKKNYSYIGAPWLKDYHDAQPDSPVIGSGNGGFSLRKVRHHLRTLLSVSYNVSPAKTKRVDRARSNFSKFSLLFNLAASSTITNNTFFMFNDWPDNEDVFWATIAEGNFSWFQVPDWQEAMRFSLEVNPRKLINLNNNQLPFGCHAWWKYDLDFWRPFIESYGHKIS